ncbi:cardiolipin synthase ClsB [Burkholderiaceae bacterium DAT-1]|nr:cardiolipin synthase ClsB [Burkholderiaceae bacterium DAT-1]
MTLTAGNHITLLKSGTEYFPALLSAIALARHEIFLETYIFQEDSTGQSITDALILAAHRGVRVHALLDGFGSAALSDAFREHLRHQGIELLFFRPEISRLSVSRQRLRRLHRKIVCIDGLTAFVGGINIIDDLDRPEWPPRYDYAVQIRGPLVAEIRQRSAQQWQRTRYVQALSYPPASRPPAQPAACGHVPASLLIRDNVRHRRDIEHAYLQRIRHARHAVTLANAYFLPGRSFRRALQDAAQRGVTVTILLQGRVDHALIFHAARFLYPELCSSGIQVFEYKAGLMHAKAAVFDRQWLTVGSSNIDPFSLLTAREANVLIQHGALARELEDDILQHCYCDSVHINAEGIAMHRGWRRVKAWIAYQLVRLLLGLTGYGAGEYGEDE